MGSFLGELRSGFAEMAPSRFPYARFLAALVLGTIGGYLFFRAGLPLPWMLGPMTVCTLAALVRAPISAPPVVRPPMSAVIGVLLGAAFTPDVIGRLDEWVISTIGLAAFVAVSGLVVVTYFRVVARFDPVTAYFSGMPGGLVEMVIVGEAKGGDGRTIALIHSARILLVVMTLPFLVQWVEGVALGARPAAGPSVLDAPLSAEAWILVCGLVGTFLGHVLRLPAKVLLGPMLVSAAVHVTGVSDFRPPVEIVAGAQVVLGVTIGARFLGTPPREILRILVLSVGSTVILLALTLAFASVVGRIMGLGTVPLILAYSPGGLAEMSLVAIAVQTEVAFVAAHHIIRIVLVMAGAGPVFALINRGGRSGRT
ncbi:AbrB family transcriptional regulator [Salinarimonas sp. NSM]|uniref:AbrB family transcriptional regulator n=1 Tax=Salinarimonas sp. NSM TaxID=3458003 RepID=UPI0040353680